MRAFKNLWKRFKCTHCGFYGMTGIPSTCPMCKKKKTVRRDKVKEVYNAIKELQEEFLKYPPRDDFNRGYFAALSKSLVVINEITKKK